MKKFIVVMLVLLLSVSVFAQEDYRKDDDFRDDYEDRREGNIAGEAYEGDFRDDRKRDFDDRHDALDNQEFEEKDYDKELEDNGLTETLEEDIYEGIGDVKIEGTAGLTPDSNFYFLESLVESVLVGDNPETALKYKEEKVLEIEEMIRSGNKEAAQKALEGVEKYNEILKKEVTPELDKQVRESSKATKELLKSFEPELEGEEWDELKVGIDENIKTQDKIALAAKISNKIKDLCETLSALDPLEYSNICKTGDDAPKWKRDLDEKLTKEQEEEAKAFFGIMSQCFKDPEECQCEEISIKPFADKCKVIAPLAAKCEAGSEDACRMMEEAGDPIDLLPDYLQDVLIDLEDDYGDAKHDLHIPKECVEAGATSRDACMKVMFKVHAPPECLEALESGKIDPKNENEARKACEKIMFENEAPEECIEAGLTDFRECERMMFKLDAPEECLDAGLDGSGRDDRKKCEIIRFKLEAPEECLDAGITGEKRDDWKKCEVIKFKLDSPQECLDAGLTGEGRNDWKKCDAIRFRLDAPKECLDAGITGENRNDWKKCEAIKFKLEAHPDCLAAGLTGEGRDDWRKCQKIQFKAEAPQECLDAGLTGEGRRDWDECNKIREKTESKGQRREDCGSNQLHICEDNYCKCIDKEEYDKRHGGEPGSEGPGDGDGGGESDPRDEEVCCSEPGPDDGPVYKWTRRGSCSSPPGVEFPTKIVDESHCKSDRPRSPGSPEKACDNCESKCDSKPGQRLKRTDCVNNRCECYYEPIEYEKKGDECEQHCTLHCPCGSVPGSCGCQCNECEEDKKPSTDDGTGSGKDSGSTDTGSTDSGTSEGTDSGTTNTAGQASGSSDSEGSDSSDKSSSESSDSDSSESSGSDSGSSDSRSSDSGDSDSGSSDGKSDSNSESDGDGITGSVVSDFWSKFFG